jgi:hypothetical protein
MGRMTRAKAAEVAERMHVDEDAVLDMSQIEEKVEKADPATPEQRSVLGNIAPNSADGKGSDLVGRKTRSKNKAQNTTDPSEHQVEVQGDKTVDEQNEEDALDAITNETMERLAKLRIASMGIQAPGQVSDAAQFEVAGVTTCELGDAEPADATQPTTKESIHELPSISIVTQPQMQEMGESEGYEHGIPEVPSSPVATAVPNVIKSLRKDSPTKRSTSNKENVEPVEQEQVAAASNAQVSSPPQVPSHDATATLPVASPSPEHRPISRSGDLIEAPEIVDEAVERGSLGISEAQPPVKGRSPKQAEGKPKKTKPAPVVRLTKATAARLSMAQAGNKNIGTFSTSTSVRPRPSTALGRTNGVRQSMAPATADKPAPRPKKETVIPHSKPRPISLSFPTPPPAAKSSKAPTKSTFQLPGEAVAAKLKAAREERLKREAVVATSKMATDEKKPAFKARPVPSTLKKTPSIRQTAASRARESIMTGDAALKPTTSSSTTGLKRSNTVGNSQPRPSTALVTSTKPSQPPQLTVQKRDRPSSVHIPTQSTAANAPTARNISGTFKGKEVYARFSAARNAAESDKRDKEDAARKARAAAAEKGRAASREWAEKQRVKKMIAKVEGDMTKV